MAGAALTNNSCRWYDQLTQETGTLNGAADYQTVYSSDTNGSLISQVRTGSNPETNTYTFNFQHQLATANISRTENGQQVTISASYRYNDAGIRVQSYQTTAIGNGSPTQNTNEFLIDSDNPTGYGQVLEEHVNGGLTPSVFYIIGFNVLGQTDSNGTTFFLADGSDSTRLITDALGSIVARYVYDAYGNAIGAQIGIVTPPASRILYAGQQFDTGLVQYYLRARYYGPNSGRFVSSDTFPGDLNSPGTLHKYLYTVDNPVNYADPTGHYSIGFGIALATMLGYSASIVRYVIDPGWDFQASVGFGQLLIMSFDYDTSDLDELAALLIASAELLLMDIREEFRRGVGVAASAAQLAFDAIYQTIDLNEQFLLDLVISPFFASACFAAGTPVVVGVNADGSYATKPIEDVRLGDCVLARDERNAQAEVRLQRVEEVFSRVTDYLRILTVRDDAGAQATIHTTDGHLIWVADRGWTKAGKLQVGDRLSDARGGEGVVVVSSERQDLTEPVRVYTFRVKDDHTYFVSDAIGRGRLTAWVHNVCRGPAGTFEQQMREDYGLASQTRAQRAYQLGGRTRWTDVTIPENGVSIAGEAKYVGNWSKSIYNPASPIGGKSWAGVVRQQVVKQGQNYLAGGHQRIILRTNSQEFIDYYRAQFAAAGIGPDRISFELVPLR